jgi:Tfp pilus assembly protein PilV
MIALAVISVGALGYVTSQISSLKNVSNTMTRTLATLLIYDITARMQANSAEFWQGTSSAYLGATPLNANASCYSTTGVYCTASQMAFNDLYEWQALVSRSFPSAMNARAFVCLEQIPGTASLATVGCTNAALANNPLTFTLKIYWKSVPGGPYDQVQVGTVEAPTLRASTYPLSNPTPNQ